MCYQKGYAVTIAHCFTLHHVLGAKTSLTHHPWDPHMQGKCPCRIASRHFAFQETEELGVQGSGGIREGFTEAVTLQANLKVSRVEGGRAKDVLSPYLLDSWLFIYSISLNLYNHLASIFERDC